MTDKYKISELAKTMYPDSLWLDLFNSGELPIRYEYGEKGNIVANQVYWASAECADCRTYSNSTRPDWWPEGR